MRELFLKAHQMTREIKKQYQEVDYRAQFGLCLSYLLKNRKEEKEMTKLELLSKVTGIEVEVLENRNNYKDFQKYFKAMYENDCTDKEKISTIHNLGEKADTRFNYESSHPYGLLGEIKNEFAEMLQDKGYDKSEIRKIRRDTFMGYKDTHGYFEFALKRLEEKLA